MNNIFKQFLRWQRVLDYNIGADIFLLNRLSVKFDYFISITDGLLMDVALPPSTGFSNYKDNLGKVENTGFDASVAYTPWRNTSKRGWLTVSVSAMHNTNKIKKISDTFVHRNNQENESKDKDSPTSGNMEKYRATYTRPSTLYYEGQSMSAIWGVRSAGINPITGQEMFYDHNGKLMMVWSSLDQIVMGDTSPKLRGNISLSAGFKGFTFSIACGYKFGGEIYNTTLIDKVEYTTGTVNLDRRILQAWRQPGDVAPYRKLYISHTYFSGEPVRPTSRYVMKDNEIYISSLNVGYDFHDFKSLSKIGVERLKLSFFMNELFRFSSIEIERGTSYPFARNFSIALQATF